MKASIIQHSSKLQDGHHYDALLDYCIMAWNYVRSIPIWDNNSHNAVRRQCFKILTNHCLNCIKNGGIHLGVSRLQNIEKSIKEWVKDYEDVLTCVGMLNKVVLKYRTSL